MDSMDASLSQSIDLTCPACERTFSADIWLIVDAAARPDLMKRVRMGTLHDLPCPHCGHTNIVDAPLLLYRPDRDPVIVFSPARNSSREQDQEHAAGLIGALQQRLGDQWRDAWIAEGLPGVPRNLLPTALEEGLDAALATTRGGSGSGLGKIPEEVAPIVQELSRPARRADMPRRVHLCRQALSKVDREADAPLWGALQNELANSLAQTPGGDRAENLERALHHYAQALEVRTRQAFPANWAQTMNDMAAAYYSRIRGDRAENLEQAIHHCTQALEVRTRQADPERWAATQNNLANAYADRIRGDRAENLERAIHHYTQALEVRTRQAFPADWALTQNNLATAYADRIRGDRAENLERALHHYAQAREVYTHQAFPADWARTQHNLANAYRDRIRGERAENLEHALHLYTQALEVYTRQVDPERWAHTMNNLATAYQNRIRGDRAENLERALHHYTQALEVYTRQAFPADWAQTMNNLANAYANRIRGDRAENLERALHHYTQALEVYTRQADPERWAMTQNNLANAYRSRMRGKRAENLERALHHYTQALEVRTRQAFPADWAAAQHNLANAYANRMRGDRAENLEQALHHYTQALEVYTRQAFPADWAGTQNNLANAYYDRTPFLTDGNRAENLEQALYHYTQALEVYTRQAFPDEHRGTQRNLANLSFKEERWDEAATALQGALAATNLLYQAAATPEARQAELQEIRALPSHLAYALAQSAEQTDDTSLQQAVLNLERNRARWLSEILALRSQKPPDVPEGVWQNFTNHRERIGDLQAELRLPEDTPGRRKYLTLSPALTAAYTDLDETLSEIRDYDETFMPDPTFEQIQGAAEADHPLVYIAVSSAGTAVFIVTPSAIHHIQMPLNSDALQEQLSVYLSAYGAWRRASRDAVARRAWFEALDTTTYWLWEQLMGPLVDALVDLGMEHAVLIPQGYLGLLPLHAAWIEANGTRRYAMDRVRFTYAPNARSLAAEATEAHSILAIDNPDGSLHFSDEEVAAALDTFPEAHRLHLANDEATLEHVRSVLAHHDVWHFSTHGWAGWQEPLESGLLLAHDERLTLRELLALRGQARLAVLSACETGIPGTELPDEVIGLPTGLLQVGVAGVVGSLWSVNDFSTALLMMRFYEAWRDEGQSPPEALHTAQCWLRDATNADLTVYFKRQLPDAAADRMPPDVATAGYRRFWWADDEEAQPFKHPFYWAGFYYTGV